MSLNTKTNKEVKLTNGVMPGNLFYKDGYIYFNEKGKIICVKFDGSEKRVKVVNGKTQLLGLGGNNIYYFDKKSKEILAIDVSGKEESKKSLAKLTRANYVEIMMTKSGIYYIDPSKTINYIDLDSGKNEKLLTGKEVYDLRRDGNDVFFAVYNSKGDKFNIYKANGNKLSSLVELEESDFSHMDEFDFGSKHTIKLLAAGGGVVYYGTDDYQNENVDLYSVNSDGSNHQHMFSIFDLKDIYQGAYFHTFRYDSGYLIMLFDCDEAPHETFVYNVKSKAYTKLKPGHYSNESIDIEGDKVYYAMSDKFDQYKDDFFQHTYRVMDLKKFLNR